MLKNLSSSITLVSILLLPFGDAYGNTVHNPGDVFEVRPGKKKTVKIEKVTGSSSLHAMGNKGEEVKIAVIDMFIDPAITEQLRKNGALLPSTLKQKTVLLPQDVLRLKNKALTPLQNAVLRLFMASEDENIPPEKSIDIKLQIEKMLPKLRKEDPLFLQRLINFVLRYKEGQQHGSAVVSTVHRIAPKAQILPIDTSTLSVPSTLKKVGGKRVYTDNRIAKAVQIAIANKVDVINLSCFPYNITASSYYLNPAFTSAIREASRRNIAVIFAAGNDSKPFLPAYVSEHHFLGRKTQSTDYQAFTEVKGRNTLYVGGVSYTTKGNEILTSFSQHPTASTLSRFLLAPAEQIYLRSGYKISAPSDGTSFAAPITAGAFALLKQYVRQNRLAHTTDDLLTILQKSGHPLGHYTYGSYSNTYNVLDLANAITMANSTLVKLPPVPNNIPVAKNSK